MYQRTRQTTGYPLSRTFLDATFPDTLSLKAIPCMPNLQQFPVQVARPITRSTLILRTQQGPENTSPLKKLSMTSPEADPNSSLN